MLKLYHHSPSPDHRWKRFEVHDIVIECAKVSLDPKESSCEEGYATMPEHFSAHLQLRPTDSTVSTASPYTDFHSSYGQKPVLTVDRIYMQTFSVVLFHAL